MLTTILESLSRGVKGCEGSWHAKDKTLPQRERRRHRERRGKTQKQGFWDFAKLVISTLTLTKKERQAV
jgi:hypothetical protein